MLSFTHHRHGLTEDAAEECEHACFGKDGVPVAVVLKHRSEKLQEFFGLLKKKPPSEFFSKNANNHIGETVDDVHAKLQKHVGDRGGDHMKAIKKYTKDSHLLNTTLYQSHNLGAKVPSTVKVKDNASDKAVDNVHDVSKLDDAIKAHPVPAKLHVYTGVGFHPGSIAAQHPERHIHLPAYTSSSIDPQIASQFAIHSQHHVGSKHAHMLHIELQKGHNATFVGEHSTHTAEKEVLLGRHTRVQIHPEPEIHKNAQGNKVHVWKAKIVDHDLPDSVTQPSKASPKEPVR